VPAQAYWGAQTQRSIENFPFGAGERMPIGIVHALALVKQAAARVSRARPRRTAGRAIEKAAAEVVAGLHDDQFPLVIWQTGSGTQSNMNVNEVIAGRANEQLAGTRGARARFIPTITSTAGNPRTTASPPRCTWPPWSRSTAICCPRSIC
jgi:fumarate hydratase class II